MAVSENSGTPKSSILIGFSIVNHPFWGTLIFGNTHMVHMIGENFRNQPGEIQSSDSSRPPKKKWFTNQFLEDMFVCFQWG